MPRSQTAGRSSPASPFIPQLVAAPLFSRTIHSCSSVAAAPDPFPRMPPRPTGVSPLELGLKREWTAGSSAAQPLPSRLPPVPPRVGGATDFGVPPPHLSPMPPPSFAVAPHPAARGPGRLVRAWRWLPWLVRWPLGLLIVSWLVFSSLFTSLVLIIVAPPVQHMTRLFLAPDRAARDALWDAVIVRGFVVKPFSPDVVQLLRKIQQDLEAAFQRKQDAQKKDAK